jgi:excinuclease UvrABC ATPase subunit
MDLKIQIGEACKIKKCEACEGTGMSWYQNGKDDCTHEPCEFCFGTGYETTEAEYNQQQINKYNLGIN